ncbi:MAG: SRPBCC domain-containing protein [Bacteroidia bacterium]|jgi:uncharacterized protein YndB with AHSA1/START domain|nr:SRPBCC domain-containing protein [Bacteroidia bacterium]|tara:strand:+ start:7153 stop:7575 length:423 start_codon:yes stop_codon:yes gene_type:complete
MYLIEHLFHIKAPLKKVYEAIKEVENIKQWYTNNVTENSDKTKTFKWGEMYLIVKCKEIENKKITWKFLESSMPIEALYMTYELSENEGKTRVRFSYGNFTEKSDFYANQNFSSAKYLESLRQFCQTGNGEAFGSDSYRS